MAVDPISFVTPQAVKDAGVLEREEIKLRTGGFAESAGSTFDAALKGAEQGIAIASEFDKTEQAAQMSAVIDAGTPAMVQFVKEAAAAGIDLRQFRQVDAYTATRESQEQWWEAVTKIYKGEISSRETKASFGKQAKAIRAGEEREAAALATESGLLAPKEFIKKAKDLSTLEQAREDVKKVETKQGKFRKFLADASPEKIAEWQASPAQLLIDAGIENADPPPVKDIASFLNLELDRLSREKAAAIKAKDKKEKEGKKSETVASAIELVLKLAENVPPKGRLIGFAKQIQAAVGFEAQVSILQSFGGALAGQFAKGIGGESGRLTDQDRIFAMKMIPKVTDSEEERVLKVTILTDMLSKLRDESPEGKQAALSALYSNLTRVGEKSMTIKDLKGDSSDGSITRLLLSKGVPVSPSNIDSVRSRMSGGK